MNYKEIRGNLLRILLLGLSLSLVESLNIECELDEHQFCWNFEIKTYKECTSCIINEVQLLQMGEAIEITSNNNSESSKVVKVIFEEGTLNHAPMTEILRSFPNLKHLSFRSMIISEINEVMLGNLSQLESFESKAVQFRIACSSFSSAVNLQSLLISQNADSQFLSFSFIGLENLIALSLNEDNIKQIDPIWFNEMPKLEDLNLSENEISLIEDHVFEELKNLKIVNLAYNEIETISNKLFRNNVNLERIYLSDNNIYSIQISAFGNLKHLNYINLLVNDCIDKVLEVEDLLNIEEALEKCHVVLTTTETPEEGACKIPNILNGQVYGIEDGVLIKSPEKSGSLYSYFDPVQVKCNDGFHLTEMADSKFKLFYFFDL